MRLCGLLAVCEGCMERLFARLLLTFSNILSELCRNQKPKVATESKLKAESQNWCEYSTVHPISMDECERT